jgi:alkyl hydroperoxide reductase subunit AhpF
LPYISGISHIEIVGDSQVSGVRYTVAGKEHHLSCNLVMLQQGLIPQAQIAQLLGCPPEWNDAKQCWQAQVSAGTITGIANTGCAGVSQLKSFTRAGMEACQGRQCGLNLGYLVAHAQQRPMSEVEPLSIRPPLSPINLGQLGQLVKCTEL